MHVIEFTPPMLNLTPIDEHINTFRLGAKYHRVITPGETIALIDRKEHRIFAYAIVLNTELGPLLEMAKLHARYNHNQLGAADPVESLMAAMRRRYAPSVAKDNKATSVIYFKVLA